MADINDGPTLSVKSETVECPICEQRVDVMASVRITAGEAQRYSSSDMKHNYGVHLSAKILNFRFNHACDYEGEDYG